MKIGRVKRNGVEIKGMEAYTGVGLEGAVGDFGALDFGQLCFIV